MLNMKMKQEEGEKERLIISTCKVVEYLKPLMSNELLFKFPDNSVFDFDYSQSSIWSPLVPRVHCPVDLDLDLGLITPKKLTFGFGLELDKKNKNKTKSGSKKVTSSNKKKTTTSKPTSVAFNFNLNILKMKQHKKTKVKASEFSPTPIKGGACAPFTTKVN